MASRRSAELAHDDAGQDSAAEKHGDVVVVRAGEAGSDSGRSNHVPLQMKLLSILMVTAIGFGAHWSSGVTGAMKSTLKKVRVLVYSSRSRGADARGGRSCTSIMRSMRFWRPARIS
jgi:hypothetical protein